MSSNSMLNSNDANAFARVSPSAGSTEADDASLQRLVSGPRIISPFAAVGHASGYPSPQPTDDLADIVPDERYPRGLRIAFLLVGSAGLWAVVIAAVVHVISRR